VRTQPADAGEQAHAVAVRMLADRLARDLEREQAHAPQEPRLP
jgi:hypothetical protein